MGTHIFHLDVLPGADKSNKKCRTAQVEQKKVAKSNKKSKKSNKIAGRRVGSNKIEIPIFAYKMPL